MRPIMLYNTPTIEGRKIAKSLGIVTANQVAGTGFFTDMVASFSDFFGGNSGAYRNAMEQLYKNVEEQFCQKALKIGADAIVNVRIDFDNISGKNMSMLMISVQGTAVKLADDQKEEIIQSKSGLVTIEDIELELKFRQFKDFVAKNSMVESSVFDGILGFPRIDMVQPMVQYYRYCRANQDSEWWKTGMIKVVTYLSSFAHDDLVDLMYSQELLEEKLIVELKLFDARKILEIAKTGNFQLACRLMKASKASYSKDDLADMKMLLEFFDNLPSIRHPEVVKGLFSSPHTVYVCQCGEKCEEEKIYCDSCDRNEKGLKRYDIQGLDKLKTDIDVISQLLN